MIITNCDSVKEGCPEYFLQRINCSVTVHENCIGSYLMEKAFSSSMRKKK